jgi:hypothetical protein
MNNRAGHWSGMVNFISTGGSRRLASVSFAFSRSAAALAASRSPAVVAPKNSASTFLNRSRSSSSIAMPPLLAQHDDIAPSDRQSATRRRPHLFCLSHVECSYRLQSIVTQRRPSLRRSRCRRIRRADAAGVGVPIPLLGSLIMPASPGGVSDRCAVSRRLRCEA